MDLARIAARRPRPSKEQAQNILKKLSGRLRGNKEAQNQLADLYTYFMPPLPKRAKTPFQWAAKATGRARQVPSCLQYIHVTSHYIEASDGLRAHWVANAEDLEPGFYFRNGYRALPLEDDMFVDVRGILPSESSMVKQALNLQDMSLIQQGKIWAYELRIGERLVHIQKRFLDDAANGQTTLIARACPTPDSSPAVLLECDMGWAAIAPMIIPETT